MDSSYRMIEDGVKLPLVLLFGTKSHMCYDLPEHVRGRIVMGSMRRMTAEDKPYVLELMRKFFSSDAVLTNGSEEIFANDIEECISDSPYMEGFVFTDEEGSIKGYAMIAHSYSTEFGRHCIWIEDIYLEKELRGSGAAPEFFDYLKTRYPDSVNRLEVEKENERAVSAYVKNGFEVIPYMEMIRVN